MNVDYYILDQYFRLLELWMVFQIRATFDGRIFPECHPNRGAATPYTCSVAPVNLNEPIVVTLAPSGSAMGSGTPIAGGTATPSPVIPELPPLALFGSGLLLLGGVAYRNRRRP